VTSPPSLFTTLQDALPWILLVLGAICGALLLRAGIALRQRWREHRFRARAIAGEARAVAWLTTHGFTVLEEQADRSAMMIINGTPAPFTVRADLLVRKNGRVGVVEVKTGAMSTVRTAQTRRQLLEYAAVYAVDDVYLFDATREILTHAEFPHVLRAGGGAAEAPIRSRVLLRRLLFTTALLSATLVGFVLGRVTLAGALLP
jgi:hypothetical protein